jgi:tripartite-type tricarboxylate transporter receptor subunit TctC
MVVTFPAGSGSDVLARILGPNLSEFLGQQVIIENVGGAGGITAAYRVARAAPDGYQFVLGGTDTFAQSQTLYKNPPYSATTDFAPVALIVEQPFLLVTHNDFPANNLPEFIAYAKTNQSKMQFGSAGPASGSYLTCTYLNSDRRHRHARSLSRRPARAAGFNGRPARLLLSNHCRCNRAHRK